MTTVTGWVAGPQLRRKKFRWPTTCARRGHAVLSGPTFLVPGIGWCCETCVSEWREQEK